MELSSVTETFDLSVNQKELWSFQQQIPICYGQIILDIKGAFNRPRLLEAIRSVIAKHEVLVSKCAINNGSLFPLQVVAEAGTPDIVEVMAKGQDVDEAIERSKEYLNKPYDPLVNEPIRFCLTAVSERRHFLIVRLYTLWGDSYSCNYIGDQICQQYIGTQPGQEEKEMIVYHNFAAWQNDLINEPDEEAARYWKGLTAFSQPRILPFQQPATAAFSPGGIFLKMLSSGQVRSLNEIAASLSVTTADILLGIFTGFLSSFTDQAFAVGYIPYNRSYKELDHTVGLVTKPLPLIFDNAGADRSMRSVITAVRQKLDEILPWGDYFQQEMIRSADPQTPGFFYYCFEHLELNSDQSYSSADTSFGINHAYSVTSPFLLKLLSVDYGDRLSIELFYDENVFNSLEVNMLAAQLQHFIDVYTSNLSAKPGLCKLEDKLISGANDTKAKITRNGTVLSLFHMQVKKDPHAIAIVEREQQLSYGQLDQLSDQLAGCLLTQYDLAPGDLIAVLLDRSSNLVMTLLGIMKAGVAYLPIDTALPAARLQYILEDSRAKLLITEDKWLNAPELTDRIPVVNINDAYIFHKRHQQIPLRSVFPKDLAYVIYTSGTTGNPKGTIITHRNLLNYISWANDYYFPGDQYGNWGFITAVSFDLTVTCLYASLTRGKTLFIENTGDDIASLLEKNFTSPYVDTLKLTPSHISLLKNLDIKETHVRIIICGGEQLTRAQVQTIWEINKDITVYNEYGPTETTVGSMIKKIEPFDDLVLIGKGINNTGIYIVNEDNSMAMVGVTGEICIGGVGVSRGYLNRAELTAEKFVANPFRRGERMYRTGDLGRWLAAGNVEYLGRRDDQLKVRGYRIEPGEIAGVLQSLPGVGAALVTGVSGPDGEKELVAYVTGEVDANTLRTALTERLPAYMVPVHYVLLQELPLSSNGKIDRHRLPAPDRSGLSSKREYIAPRNATESLLQTIWQDILQRELIGVRDNFFELGGHSLRATRLSGKINKQTGIKISLQELFEHATIEQQGRLLDGRLPGSYVHIPLVPVQEGYGLSSPQRRLWVLGQFGEGNTAYNIPGVYLLEGEPDLTALGHAFDALIARHEILRTVFREDGDGEVRQYIQPYLPGYFTIQQHDLRHTPGQGAVLRSRIDADSTAAFNLSEGPLLRAGLYQVADGRWVLTYVMHHIISDGWSMGVLIRELLGLYQAHVTGGQPYLPALRIQYKDYAGWQQSRLAGGQLAPSKDYWLQQLGGPLPVLDLPADHVRPSVKTYNGAMVSVTCNEALKDRLQQLSQSCGGTLFMGLLSVVNVLLHRYSGQEDIIIGSPIAGRDHVDLEDQIGFYVNTLALRTRFSGLDSFVRMLELVKEVTLGGYEHQDYPFDELVNDLSLRRDMSRHPLFDVAVVLQNTDTATRATVRPAEGLRISGYGGGGVVISKFDITFNFIELEGGLPVQIEYNRDIYSAAMMERMGHHLLQLMECLTASPHEAIGKVAYLSTEEKEQLLNVFNATSIEYPIDRTVVALFEEQVIRTPLHRALVNGEQELTYTQLNALSNQLAEYLRTHHCIQPGDIVGIRLERSEWLVVSILGILKSGAAYLPVDPAYPQDRIDYMVADSGCRALIGEEELSRFVATKDNYSAQDPTQINKATDLAYVIYTSGSTGRPKGVMIEHRSVINLCCWHQQSFGLTGKDNATLYAGVGFDASVWELFPYLLCGAALHIINGALRLDMELLSAYYDSHGITVSFLPTQVGESFMERSNSSLRYLLVGGDRLKRVGAVNYQVINNYGPTESTVVATSGVVTAGEGAPVIGRPISNTHIYILDQWGGLQPVGVQGELCISGVSLSRGYLNRGDLTAEKFIENPFHKGTLMYRTGDLCRWEADGTISYHGRCDDQLKVRGYRIEPGEIESVLQEQAGVEGAVVVGITGTDGGKELVAYIGGAAAPGADSLRSILSARLPGYMVPLHYVVLGSLPLTANGKVDRDRLPAPLWEHGRGVYEGARNGTEAQLITIWEEVLGRPQISIHDNFFDIGGHSLKAISMINKIKKHWSITITISEVFQMPTIEDLAKDIQAKAWRERSGQQEIVASEFTDTIRI